MNKKKERALLYIESNYASDVAEGRKVSLYKVDPETWLKATKLEDGWGIVMYSLVGGRNRATVFTDEKWEEMKEKSKKLVQYIGPVTVSQLAKN
jgi:hypothetical protein